MDERPQTLMDYLISQRVADETLKAYTPSQEEPVRAIETRSISPNPPEPGRNLLNPYLPGTREWTANLDKQINDMPYPSTTMSSEHLMGAAGLAPMAFTAYHGSPRTDLTKFKDEFIGTGEGSQVFGHGHYLAENPSVAGTYTSVGQGPVRKYTTELKDALRELDYLGYDTYSEALHHLDVTPGWRQSVDTKGVSDKSIKTIEDYLSKYPRGKVYSADIKPPKEHFMNWDKSLSEQSDYVRDILTEELKRMYPTTYKNVIDRSLRSPEALYLRFGETNGGISASAAASKRLREIGIPGIKYLDAGSRPSGKGTYNYVVFSDKDVEILK